MTTATTLYTLLDMWLNASLVCTFVHAVASLTESKKSAKRSCIGERTTNHAVLDKDLKLFTCFAQKDHFDYSKQNTCYKIGANARGFKLNSWIQEHFFLYTLGDRAKSRRHLEYTKNYWLQQGTPRLPLETPKQKTSSQVTPSPGFCSKCPRRTTSKDSRTNPQHLL